MQSLEVRVSVVEDDIRDVKSDLKELKKEMSEQDEKIERKIDEKFREIENKIDRNNDVQTSKTDKIADGIDSIKDAMHRQELTNLDLNNKVSAITKDRDDEVKERNKMKWGIYGIGFSLASSFIFTWLKITLGF
ncbi:hypothetical protein [Staphylococcus chromogenes]|uniref:hypothetical protein n=1 Tax=Staphylococcus chromogenes TaxID=46126 RepID=UPI0028884C6B|nr:hypothetical protein [Staphylococcus chromogenes]MDT0700448.1 hypothetical protein [Staphylococcus chromogenes]